MKKLQALFGVFFLLSFVAPASEASFVASVGHYNGRFGWGFGGPNTGFVYTYPAFYPNSPVLVGWGGAFFVGPNFPLGYYGYYGTFGAIAYSPRTGQAGWSHRYMYSQDAANEALFHCRAADCRTMVWFRSACGAVASHSIDPTIYGWAWSSIPAFAQSQALAECNAQMPGCVIAAAACSR